MIGSSHRGMRRTYKRWCLCSMFTGTADTGTPLGFSHAPLIEPAAPAALLLQADVCDGDVSAHRLSTQGALVRISEIPQARMAAKERWGKQAALQMHVCTVCTLLDAGSHDQTHSRAASQHIKSMRLT